MYTNNKPIVDAISRKRVLVAAHREPAEEILSEYQSFLPERSAPRRRYDRN